MRPPPMMPMMSAAALAIAAPAAAAPPIDVSAYPELAPGLLLPPIAAQLRRTLKDPQSVKDFTLCPATKIKMKDGRPVRWAVLFSLNARNSFGGYAGLKIYSAIFREGRIAYDLMPVEFGGNGGIEGLLNSIAERKMAGCPMVPDERIQALIAGTSIYKPVQ